MKRSFLSLVLFCGLALFSTSCNKDNNDNNGNVTPVTPEVQNGSMSIGTQSHNIVTADAVTYGQQNAIVVASKAMSEDDNDGIAIVFNGDITPGNYSATSKATTVKVVGLHEFNMSELPFIMSSDTIYFGDAYYWISGELSVIQNADGTYSVVLSQCVGANANGHETNLALNFSGTLTPYVFDANNKFVFKGRESAIGLATLTSLTGFDAGVRSMMFMSADRQRFFIVSFLGDAPVDGEYNLGYLGTPYLPKFPCVHVALDADFWTFQPQTGYIAQSGTLRIATNDDGTKTITVENGRFKNVEHDNEFFWPIQDGSLYYHGNMFEVGN